MVRRQLVALYAGYLPAFTDVIHVGINAFDFVEVRLHSDIGTSSMLLVCNALDFFYPVSSPKGLLKQRFEFQWFHIQSDKVVFSFLSRMSV